MPMLHITAQDHGPGLHDAPPSGGAMRQALQQALAQDPGPVTVMLHGYKYLPGHPLHCPHSSLLAPSPVVCGPKIVSWPQHLGFDGTPGEGVGLAFGWPARGSIWQAFDRAGRAGAHLAEVLAEVRALDPNRPIHAIGHSMGARVILEALRLSAPRVVSRAVLLAAAEFHDTACAALDSPGGRTCAVLNVTSRENDLYDFMIERLIPAPRPGDRVLGFGAVARPNVVTVQIDDPQSLALLRRAGFGIAPPARRVCHWSSYRRPGVFGLYHAFVREQITLPQLRALLPEETAPRWSRLMPPLPALPGPGPHLAR